MPHLRSVFAVVLALSTLASASDGGSARIDAKRLRTLFFLRDYETAVIEGTQAGAATSKQTEVRAWFVLNLARSGKESEAIALAEAMTRSRPDGWCWFALAGALSAARERPDVAVAAAESARARLRNNADVVWMQAQTLANHPTRRGEVAAFVDREKSRIKNPAELLVSKAYALYVQATSPTRDDAGISTAMAAFDEARRKAPSNLNAWYLPGAYLLALRRTDEAHPLLEKATGLSPGSTDVHQAYWRAITGSRSLSPEQKRQEIEADVTRFQQANRDRPGALLALSQISREMKWSERQAAYDAKLLGGFCDTIEAEWVLAYRWRDLGQSMDSLQSPKVPELRRMLTEYIARPRHNHEGLLGEAYLLLFTLLQTDSSVPGDEFYRVAEGALKYEDNNPQIVWVDVPVQLAQRRIRLADAERIAREGIDVLRKRAESRRSLYKAEGEYERVLASLTGLGHDALGWVLFAQDRFEEAEKELLAAYELNHEERKNLEHLGRFYLSRGNQAKAEDYFVKGLMVQSPGENPCEKALREVYEKRRGSLEGFGDYLATLKDTDRQKRRAGILATRTATPASVPAFTLRDLGGRSVSLDSLKGRIVVINYWGIWCGWCVKELPDYQKLFEKYANDPRVAILTIDNDQNPDSVKPWMAEKKYTFPVLLDERYVTAAGITTFPTTWFLDQEGRKVFEKVGWSQELLEEFGWRIEALRK
jgi:tetratricopeptide (TPR) repeat protein